MTINEFYDEFNLAYNNLASNQAAGLDKYEISVYLTKAQNTLVDALYAEFEKSEEARRKLAPIVVTAKLNPKSVAPDKILYTEYTSTYEPLSNIRYIINEQVKISNESKTCVRNKFIKVCPCLHDELDTTMENPFKFNIRRALRLDVSDGTDSYIEILTKDKNIEYYQIRYIKNPEPIILDDLNNYYGSPNIDGQTNPSTGSLSDNIHRQIVEIAAKLAYQDYKQ